MFIHHLWIGFAPFKNPSKHAKTQTDLTKQKAEQKKGHPFSISLAEIIIAIIFVLFVAAVVLWRIFITS